MVPFINNPVAKTVEEWPVPINFPPEVGPSANATPILISCNWLAYVAGACKALRQEAAWKTTSDAQLIQTLGWVDDLLGIFMKAAQEGGCFGAGPAFSCPYDFRIVGGLGGGFVNLDESPFTPNFIGVWSPTEGWASTSADFSGTTEEGVTIFKTFSPAIVVNDVEMVYNVVKGSFSHGTGITRNIIILSNGGTTVGSAAVFSDADPDGSDKVLQVPGTFTIDRIDLRVHSAWRNGSVEPLGHCAITNLNCNTVSGGCPVT